jgi:AmiR/NasT family two-component response regulator
LTFARDSNRRIVMAMGIVMRQHHVGEREAFDALRHTSQNTTRNARASLERVFG